MAPTMPKRFINLPYSIWRANSRRLPTASILSNRADNHAPVSFDDKSKFLKATHHTEIRKMISKELDEEILYNVWHT